LIVMGVRGRSTLGLAVFGSTTNHVVRAARCPVLTIRTA
jgi:nucleotide-binding universal stress UspA family protein